MQFFVDPSHDDDFMDKVELEAKEVFSDAFVAKEGMKLISMARILNLENLMTSHDFRIIGSGVGNIKFVYLVANDGWLREGLQQGL